MDNIYQRFLAAKESANIIEVVDVAELYIDGEVMPSPSLSGIEISVEKIWSNNTGRTAASPCNMVGTILAIKRTLDIKWPVLTPEEVAKLDAALSSSTPFHELRFVDMTGKDTTITVYFGTPKYGIYSYVPEFEYIEGTAVTAIEQ